MNKKDKCHGGLRSGYMFLGGGENWGNLAEINMDAWEDHEKLRTGTRLD